METGQELGKEQSILKSAKHSSTRMVIALYVDVFPAILKRHRRRENVVEIMLGVWLVCFCLSALTLAINFHLTYRKMRSRALRNLNLNLEKVQMYWSNSAGNFAPLTSGAIEKDRKDTLRNAFLLGFLSLGSLPGFLLHFIIVVSLHLLARTRKEIATFRSPLASDPGLDKTAIERWIRDLSQIH